MISTFFQHFWDYLCIPWSWIKLTWSYLSEKKFLSKQGYIKYPQFKKIDKEFKKAYQFINPYQVFQSHASKEQKDSTQVYGETPLQEIAQIWEHFQLYDAPLVFDLGAGRGRAALFLSYALSMRVIAVEQVPMFCQKLRQWENARFSIIEKNFFSIRYNTPALIYLYGTALNETEIVHLTKNFLQDDTPLQILTTSYPLEEYNTAFITQGEFPISFPWGKTKVYLNQTPAFKQHLQKRI